ncbi:TPA: glycosyltransferase family 4 protein, partial [Streptococcus pneumoniae]
IKKGQELFLSYFLKLPKEIQMQYTLTFYGSGKSKYIKKLQKMSQHLCSDQVKFHSYIDNLTELLPNYDIGINFSTTEGFGRVIVEYLANGLCVVASKNGASPELITEEVGFLIDKDNQDEFIQLFTKLSIEKNKIRQMGNKAIEHAQKFSIDQHTREIINVYQEMRNKQ